MYLTMYYFFFFSSRRRHTRCLSDWSSDVCSSDLVLDGAGIGAMPDAPEWGDAGADTFGHILESRAVRLPNLQRYGLGNIRPLEALPPLDELRGSYGRCALRSNGKDTTTGHWEMAGIVLEHAFPTYPN